MQILTLQEEELARKVGPCPESLTLCSLRPPILWGLSMNLLAGTTGTWAGQRESKDTYSLLYRPDTFPLLISSSSFFQVQPSDSLEPEFTKKCQSLLNRWREKVFDLMVQLKAQELEHRDSVKQLKSQVSGLSVPPCIPPHSPVLLGEEHLLNTACEQRQLPTLTELTFQASKLSGSVNS